MNEMLAGGDSYVAEVEDEQAYAREASSEGFVSDDLVGLYLKQIRRAPLLNAEQEIDLACGIEVGLYAQQRILKLQDRGRKQLPKQETYLLEELQTLVEQGEVAKKQMIEANLRLVVSIAKRFTGRGMLFMDVIQEGNLGLITAVEKFDYKKGFRFSTHATPVIRGTILRSLANQSRTIRTPVPIVELLIKSGKARHKLRQDLGREPTSEEIAKKLNITPNWLRYISTISRPPLSLAYTEEGDDGLSVQTTLEGVLNDEAEEHRPFRAVAHLVLSETLKSLLSRLDATERKVMELRYGLADGVPCTEKDVGKVIGLDSPRIQRIEADVKERLRDGAGRIGLREFLAD